MTIKGLSAFVKAKFPYARRRVPIEFFKGRRVALDALLFSYAYLSTARGKEAKKLLHARKMEIDQKLVLNQWLGRWTDTITAVKDAGLIPVLVFDGPNVPPEKAATRAKRNKGKEDVRAEIAELQKELETEDLEAKMDVRERLVKLIARDTYVPPDFINALRKELDLAGVVTLTADGEGDALCASLVASGQCYASYTQDSDAGAYLTDRVIIDIDRPSFTSEGQRIQLCTVIYYQQVLKQLQLSASQFQDLCIMCGTDYNDNIPGYGPAKSYGLLREYGSLENMPVAKYDPTPLNYVRIREIFTTPATILKGDLATPPVPQPAELAAFLAANNLLKQGGRLVTLLGGTSRPPPVYVPNNYEDAELL